MKSNHLTKQKKIAFIIYYPYQWFIYKNIYKLLPEDKREVVLDLNVHKNLQQAEVEKNIKKLLAKENVSYRILDSLDSVYDKNFINFFSDVEVIVSCWESGCVSDPRLSGIKKVGLTYGLAKELNTVRPARSVYDIILAYGKRDQALFGLLTKSVAIGNPRLDQFYSGEGGGSEEMKKLEQFRDPRKKTVLYVPTHGDLGSFKEMLDAFTELSKKYNVVFKPHYYSLREDSEIIARYREVKEILVINDTWDTVEVMAEADVIVSDNSSAIFDAMQVDKPIVVCDFLSYEFLDITHKNLRFSKRGVVGAVTYSSSFEQEAKAKGLVLTIKRPGELELVLGNIDSLDVGYREKQRALVREHFAHTDGSASKRAASVIMDIFDKPRNYNPGILHHAYLSYGNRLYRSLMQKQSRKNQKRGDVVLWIFCDKEIDTNVILGTIYSSLGEKDLKKIIVSGISKETFSEFSEEVSNVFFFDSHQDAIPFVYEECKHGDALLFVKANTLIHELETAISFKEASKRSTLFFAESLGSDSTQSGAFTFNLLKHETLGLVPLSGDILITVDRNQLHGLEMAGALISTNTILEHEKPGIEALSFEKMMSFFIMIDSLQSTNFALMPNLFYNYQAYESGELFGRLARRGLYLERVNVPIRMWPDNKIGLYIFKIISGKFEYYHLLRLVIVKITSVLKHRLLTFIRVAYLIEKRNKIS